MEVSDLMEPTVIVYSSHNRCNYIHNDWIVQRALRGNRQILFLPMSNGLVGDDEYDRQMYSWGTFRWFFDFYWQYGLKAFPFFWNSGLTRDDVDKLMHFLWASEVVILGGGDPWLGIERYRSLGARFYNEPDCFERILKERQERGLLTAGFSAGVDQLCEYVHSSTDHTFQNPRAFGLARNIIAASHFEHGREGMLAECAHLHGDCLVFGLPNDSGLSISQGRLPSGNFYQMIQFLLDTSWSRPEDQWHIKTRHGVKIHHIYPDGRHWAFSGGDVLVRLHNEDYTYQEAFIVPPHSPIRDYWSQHLTQFASIDHILKTH